MIMEEEFSPQYAYVASDSMSLLVRIARYVGGLYQELLQSLESS
jgi:hypothetical protein